MIRLQAFGFDVESYDKETCDGEIVTARLARKNARLRDVDFFVIGKTDGFDAVVHELENKYEKGSKERGALLELCEYRRVSPYGLFDGVLNMKRLELFGFEIKKRLFFDITSAAHKHGLAEQLFYKR